MANQLANATSPYLLQHKDNPVDWRQWGTAAFEEARSRDVPVFLSVGYAACHWCHVMAHESFEDETTARYLNENFVSIKVDREERPDVDAVYMTATQAMTGQGGWPMTCFLTPQGDPFHCGTYFPPAPRHGMPSFPQLLAAVVDAWSQRREDVVASAGRVTEELAKHSAALPASPLGAAELTSAVSALTGDFDAERGGFGGAPKFPPSMVLEFLLRQGSPEALSIVDTTAAAMARGGLYDQLAGGFARYSVDAEWVVPHFEKMLYDNALLLRMYTHLLRRNGSYRHVVEQTVAFLLEELRTDEGGFAAALDADTDGVEGLTYVWTPAQLREVLGEADGSWAADLLRVTEKGTFEQGASTLQLRADPDDPERWQRVRAALLTARRSRPQPACDDKVVAEWNGVTIAALAEAGVLLGRSDWVDAAERAADFLLRVQLVDGRLLRTSRHGVSGAAQGVLADYGCLADGLLALHQATGSARWLARACDLLDTAIEQFAGEDGAWFDTAHDAEKLISRPADPTDNATPSGASAVTAALVSAAVLADPTRANTYGTIAEASIRRAGLLAARVPRFAGHWLAAARASLDGPLQVAVVGDDERAAELRTCAVAAAPGGTVVVAGEPNAEGVPLLADRPLVDGSSAAYVCRGFVCEMPTTNIDALRAQLTG
jgi:hypothetical protein